MRRHALTDEQWQKLQPTLPRQQRGPESLRGNRLFVEGVLYRLRTGCPWRDLPECFGPWKSVYNRFNRWAHKGHWESIFKQLQVEMNEEGIIVDGSIARAHQDAAGGKGGSNTMHWDALEAAFQRRSTR